MIFASGSINAWTKALASLPSGDTNKNSSKVQGGSLLSSCLGQKHSSLFPRYSVSYAQHRVPDYVAFKDRWLSLSSGTSWSDHGSAADIHKFQRQNKLGPKVNIVKQTPARHLELGREQLGTAGRLGGLGRMESRRDSLINLPPQGGAPGLQLYHEGAWANHCPLEEASGGKGRQARAQLHLPPGWLALLLHGWAQIDCDMIGSRINSGASMSG